MKIGDKIKGLFWPDPDKELPLHVVGFDGDYIVVRVSKANGTIDGRMKKTRVLKKLFKVI